VKLYDDVNFNISNIEFILKTNAKLEKYSTHPILLAINKSNASWYRCIRIFCTFTWLFKHSKLYNEKT